MREGEGEGFDQNALLAIGALWACLTLPERTARVRAEWPVGATMKVHFAFLRSPYLVTIQRLEEEQASAQDLVPKSPRDEADAGRAGGPSRPAPPSAERPGSDGDSEVSPSYQGTGA